MQKYWYLVTTVAIVIIIAVSSHGNSPTPNDVMRRWAEQLQELRQVHPLANMTTPEIIAAMGYPVEVHHVTTDDGYILELHRIPHGKNEFEVNLLVDDLKDSSKEGSTFDYVDLKGEQRNERYFKYNFEFNDLREAPPRPVAFLQHGLLSSSSDWISNTCDEALAYIMADAGYDVWLGNFRGNTYSRRHVTLSTENKAFWQFSWDEMGHFDLPAAIDYVLATAGVEDLHYVGFSMGSTTFFAMLSDKPEYNTKIKVAALLGPAAYVEYLRGPLRTLAPYSHDLDIILSWLGYNEFLPSTAVLDRWVALFCDVDHITAEICYNVLFLIQGSSPELNKEYLPLILAHTPAGTSTHTVNHYGQSVATTKFDKYDYGIIGNIARYGQSTPPCYNLSHVVAPVGLFWSDNDWLADPRDVARLQKELPNVLLSHRVEKPEFTHLDFAWALHANELVYRHVLDFFSKFQQQENEV